MKDDDVRGAIASRRAADEEFIVIQEGFVNNAEIITAKANGADAVILGEELLAGREGASFEDILRGWIG